MQPPGLVSQDGYWLWNGSEWVPNPYRPGAYAPYVRPYESAQFRATIVTLLLLANMGAVFLLIVFDGLDAVHVENGSPQDTFFFIEGAVALVGLLAFYGSFIPAVVFYCMWLHRVVRNMPSLGALDPRWTPGGAVGRCFIPFLNFVHPLLSVLDAWRGSASEHRWLDRGMRNAISVPPLIVVWWAAWLLERLFQYLGFRMQQSHDMSTQLAGIGLDVVSQLLILTAAALAILIVRRLTARQEKKNELIATGQLV